MAQYKYEIEGYLVNIGKFSIAIYDADSFPRKKFLFSISQGRIDWENFDKYGVQLKTIDEKLKRVIVFCDKLLQNKAFW